MNKINFRDLALVNFALIILINLLIAYLMTKTVVVFDQKPVDDGSQLLFLSTMATILLILGIIFTLISIVRKERKDFRYKFCVWAYPIFILITVISMVLV
jgi:hypothetical protein